MSNAGTSWHILLMSRSGLYVAICHNIGSAVSLQQGTFRHGTSPINPTATLSVPHLMVPLNVSMNFQFEYVYVDFISC